jgi:hypothetical protein
MLSNGARCLTLHEELAGHKRRTTATSGDERRPTDSQHGTHARRTGAYTAMPKHQVAALFSVRSCDRTRYCRDTRARLGNLLVPDAESPPYAAQRGVRRLCRTRRHRTGHDRTVTMSVLPYMYGTTRLFFDLSLYS